MSLFKGLIEILESQVLWAFAKPKSLQVLRVLVAMVKRIVTKCMKVIIR